MEAATDRIAYIDGLRAIAVLSVVLCHVAQIYGLPFFPGYYMQEGAHGVDLFFVISGFCLSYPTLRSLRSSTSADFNIGRFVAARIVRIIPPYWAAIAVTIIAYKLAGGQMHGEFVLRALRDMIFVDPTFLHINGAFWTLPVELRWYALFPLLLVLWVRSPRAFTFVGACTLLSAFTQARSTDLDVLPAFMLGIVAADLSLHSAARSAYTVLLAIALMATASQVHVEALGWSDGIRNPLWYAFAFFLVLGTAGNRILCRALSHRVVAFVGYASYSIYLVHVPAIWLARAFGLPTVGAAFIAVIAPVGFWTVFERPFISGNVRSALLAKLSRHVPIWLRRTGIPTRIVLTRIRNAMPDYVAETYNVSPLPTSGIKTSTHSA